MKLSKSPSFQFINSSDTHTVALSLESDIEKMTSWQFCLRQESWEVGDVKV